MGPVHDHPCFNFDHTTNPAKKRMKKLNKDVSELFHSSKIRISTNLIYKFRAFQFKMREQIEQFNCHANQSLGGNIHRIEFPECNALFEELKNSIIPEEKRFMTQFASAVALPNGYRVKGYLTWSSFHKLYPPSVATFNTRRSLLLNNDIGCPHKICFFSLEKDYDYYLQLWNRSDANNGTEALTGEKLCRIPTDFLRIFPGDVIHGGGFKTLNSSGNFRVQLFVTSPSFEKTRFICQKTIENVTYLTIDESFLKRFKFDVESCEQNRLLHSALTSSVKTNGNKRDVGSKIVDNVKPCGSSKSNKSICDQHSSHRDWNLDSSKSSSRGFETVCSSKSNKSIWDQHSSQHGWDSSKSSSRGFETLNSKRNSDNHSLLKTGAASTFPVKTTVNSYAFGSGSSKSKKSIWNQHSSQRGLNLDSSKSSSLKNMFSTRTSDNHSLLEPFKAKTDWSGVNKIAPSMDRKNSDSSPDYGYYGPNNAKEKSLPRNKGLPIAKSTFNDKSNTMVERNNSCLAIESEVSANKSISKAFQVPTVSKKKNTIETNLCCVIEDSTNLQVNVPYTPIVTSNNKNNVCVINNDIQSNVETNNDELDNESLLIDYEASDSEELSFSQTLETINNDIDICSTSGDNNQNVLNLTPNPLNVEDSY